MHAHCSDDRDAHRASNCGGTNRSRAAGLTVKELKFFDAGLEEFGEVASVTGAAEDTEPGLGPRFNMTGCAACHAHPAVGGTSPLKNPQVDPAVNPGPAEQIAFVTHKVPILVSVGPLSETGPVREVRFSTDGGVHQLFTIAGQPDAPGGCAISQPPFDAAQVATAPQDFVHYDLSKPEKVIDNVSAFANFMRFLAPPARVTSYPGVTNAQITAGEAAFDKAGCSACHTKSMQTGNHVTAALRNQPVNLFSDLLLHDVGTGDDIAQGNATGAQFRTAPLWGAGQRIFFLHDGRTENLVDAIHAHGGEAARVVNNFKGVSTGADRPFNLSATERQNLIFFLRSL